MRVAVEQGNDVGAVGLLLAAHHEPDRLARPGVQPICVANDLHLDSRTWGVWTGMGPGNAHRMTSPERAYLVESLRCTRM